MTRAASVAFRVDADQEVGLGHLRRCLTLANRLGELGCEVCLVCRSHLEPSLSPLVASHTVCTLEHQPPAAAPGSPDEELWDAAATLRVLGPGKGDASWVVVDHYRLGHRWERRIRDAGYRVMAIDDFRSRRHHADLLVSDSESPFDPTLNERPGLARTLVGREYSLIGSEYAYARLPHPRKKDARRLLVSYGGSDPTRETMKAIAAVDTLRKTAAARDLVGRVEIVVGHFNPLAGDIVQAAQRVEDVMVHRAPPSLAGLMRAADLVLTTGGNSMVEALAIRKPCLVTVTASNQALMANQLAAEGLIRLLSAPRGIAAEDVAEAIVKTLADFEAFEARVAARPFFDHLGPQRIAAAMLAPPGGAG